MTKQVKKQMKATYNKRHFAPYSLPCGGQPRKVPEGKFIWHNHIMHCVGMGHGINGFRYIAGWLPVDYKAFMRCDCGVIPLPHYCIRGKPQRCVSLEKVSPWFAADDVRVPPGDKQHDQQKDNHAAEPRRRSTARSPRRQ